MRTPYPTEDCNRCEGHGWLYRYGREIECDHPLCVRGQIDLEDLTNHSAAWFGVRESA